VKDAEIHMTAALGAIVLTAALSVPMVFFVDKKGEEGPILDNMESIEASLAYKKPNAPKQPQKHMRAPDPEVKPEGISHDETKKVDDKKPDKHDDKKPSKDTDPLAKYHRADEDDSQVGTPNETVGAFDGSEFGVGDVTKGDPYFQRLVVDLAWQAPELAKASSAPVGCIHLTADGKIAETKFKDKSDDDIQPLAEAALKALQTKRNANPEEVPTHLLKQLTTRWVCFKFTVKSSE
jgi:hypothetical protein